MGLIDRLVRAIRVLAFGIIGWWRKLPFAGPMKGPGIFGTCIQIAPPSKGSGDGSKPWVRIGQPLTGDLNTLQVLVTNTCKSTIKAGIGIPQWAGDLEVTTPGQTLQVTGLRLVEDIAPGGLGYAACDFRLRLDRFGSDWKISFIAGTVSTVCGKSLDHPSHVKWDACT